MKNKELPVWNTLKNAIGTDKWKNKNYYRL